MSARFFPTACAVAMLFAFSAFPETTFYVSPNGNDADPGTREQPFGTLWKARETVFNPAKCSGANVTVILRGGVYALTTPWRFDANDPCENNRSITFKAETGETPVISGGKVVAGWTRDKGVLWKAAVDAKDLRQLYVNGKRSQRARGTAPESLERYGDTKLFDGDAGYATPSGEMLSWRNPKDIEFGYYNSWGHMICKVNGISPDDSGGAKISMLQPWFSICSTKEGVQATNPDYIENAFELLDEPGEWYFDKSAQTLYYIPLEGEDMATAQVVAPTLETLMELRGVLARPVHGLRFEGLTFADATWLSPNQIGHADVQANCTFTPTNIYSRLGFLTVLHNEYQKSPGNVVLQFARDIRFERCVFTRLGGAGLDLDKGCEDNVVSGCRFYDISGNGIQIGNIGRQDHHPDDPRLVVRDNTVANCLIERVGAEFQDSVGIFCGYVNGTVIAHNEIRDLPYSGMSVGWGWGEEDEGGGAYEDLPFRYSTPTPCGNNRIEYNHIHNVMLLRNDGGGIYTLGNQKGSTIRGNHVHDNNKGGAPGGIYLDEGSGYFEIAENVVYGVDNALNFNNNAQDRVSTCPTHDNVIDATPGSPNFPKELAAKAGLEPSYSDLLN
jgi:hypothetical protein